MLAKTIVTTTAFGLLLAGPAAAEFKWIKTENEYRAQVVGKTASNEAGWAINHRDGTVTGKFGKKKFAGKWVWSGRYYCRNGRLGGQEIGSDCLKIEVDGNQMRLTRQKGKGEMVLWQLK